MSAWVRTNTVLPYMCPETFSVAHACCLRTCVVMRPEPIRPAYSLSLLAQPIRPAYSLSLFAQPIRPAYSLSLLAQPIRFLDVCLGAQVLGDG